MTTKTFFMIATALGVAYGLGFLLVPNVLGTIYGSQNNPAAILGYRYFGFALLGFGLMCWALKDVRDPTILQTALIGHAVSDVAAIAVSAWGTMNGTLNALGWMNVALFVALGAACLYLYRGLSGVGEHLAA